jgi:hypothetical protein
MGYESRVSIDPYKSTGLGSADRPISMHRCRRITLLDRLSMKKGEARVLYRLWL